MSRPPSPRRLSRRLPVELPRQFRPPSERGPPPPPPGSTPPSSWRCWSGARPPTTVLRSRARCAQDSRRIPCNCSGLPGHQRDDQPCMVYLHVISLVPLMSSLWLRSPRLLSSDPHQRAAGAPQAKALVCGRMAADVRGKAVSLSLTSSAFRPFHPPPPHFAAPNPHQCLSSLSQQHLKERRAFLS